MSDNTLQESIKELTPQLKKAASDIGGASLAEEKKQDLIARIEKASKNLQNNPGFVTLENADDVLFFAKTLIEIDKTASTNPVSGLPNRHMFDRDLGITINRVLRDTEARAHFAVLFADADSFKEINEDYSHAVGDDAIRQIGDTLSNTVRADESIYHWGGDEFALILRDVSASSDEEAKKNFGLALHRHQEAFRESIFEHNGEKRPLTMSMGIYMISKDDFPANASPKEMNDAVQSIAEVATYEDKGRKDTRQAHVWDIINGNTTPNQALEQN